MFSQRIVIGSKSSWTMILSQKKKVTFAIVAPFSEFTSLLHPEIHHQASLTILNPSSPGIESEKFELFSTSFRLQLPDHKLLKTGANHHFIMHIFTSQVGATYCYRKPSFWPNPILPSSNLDNYTSQFSNRSLHLQMVSTPSNFSSR